MLEHHERMDGSGYPRGLPGAEISPMGRILLLAEVVTAFYEKYTDMPAQRLSLVLRLNHRKFPAALVAHVLPLLHEDVARDSALMPLGADAPVQIDTLAGAFEQWEQLKAALPPAARLVPGSVFAFADIRLQALQKALIEAGLWLALPYLVVGIGYTFVNAARVDWMQAQLELILPAGANIAAFAESILLWPLLLLTPLICP